MINKNQIITDVRNFIAKDEASKAIELLRYVLENDKILDEVIIQSAKKYRIEREVRTGVISFDNASITKNQIYSALLEICRNVEEAVLDGTDLRKNEDVVTKAHFLHQFPRGPMVEGHFISEKIIESFAKIINPRQAMLYIDKANRTRREADPNDDSVTILESYTLLSPLETRPMDFWLDAFHEARLHGPRMLAALLMVLSDEQFSEEAKQAKYQLYNYLKNHK
jgi:hypothetical protein